MNIYEKSYQDGYLQAQTAAADGITLTDAEILDLLNEINSYADWDEPANEPFEETAFRAGYAAAIRDGFVPK